MFFTILQNLPNLPWLSSFRDYCQGLKNEIVNINSRLKTQYQWLMICKFIKQFERFGYVKEEIDNPVGNLKINCNFTSQIESYQSNATKYMDDFESYDEDRELAGTIFFIIPLLWIILWTIGIILAIRNLQIGWMVF